MQTYLAVSGCPLLCPASSGVTPMWPDLMKPHPSCVLAALELAEKEALNALLIGDSATDVETSHATSVRVIG
jgi:hypothetical protein